MIGLPQGLAARWRDLIGRLDTGEVEQWVIIVGAGVSIATVLVAIYRPAFIGIAQTFANQLRRFR